MDLKEGRTSRSHPFCRIFRKEAFLKPLAHPLAEFPYYVDIELTNRCNIHCRMCWRQIMTREQGLMTEEVYRRIVDEVACYDAGLRYCRLGEPTIHPQFVKYLEYANELKIPTYLSTNGTYPAKLMRRIFQARPDVIRFSFQGLNAEEYEKWRTPARFHQVAENIALCRQERERHRWIRPYLTISTTVLDEPPAEIAAFRKEWESVVDRVEVEKTDFSWVKPDGDLRDEIHRSTIANQYLPCVDLLTKIAVDWNGDITACCKDFDAWMVLGNIRQMTLKEAWDSEKERHYRSMVSHDLRHAELPLCKNCLKGKYKLEENPVAEEETKAPPVATGKEKTT